MTERYARLDTFTGELTPLTRPAPRKPYKRHSTKRTRTNNHLLFVGVMVIIGLVEYIRLY